MFEPLEGRELNIGSLPKSTEGATTIGAKYASHFALCLTPQLWTSSYRNTVRDNLDELADRTGLKGLQRLLGIEDRQSPAELSESDVSVYLSILGTGYGIGFRGPWTVVVLSDHLSGHRKIRVEIVDDFDEILVARPIPVGKDSEPVGVGSNIEITVDEIRDSVIRGTYGPRLIEVHRTDSQPGKSLRAAITDIDEEHIVASVAALDESLRPSVGDLVTFEAGQLAEYPDIPVMIPASLPDVHTPLSLVVDSVETDGLRASVSKMPEFSSFSVGQELSVTADTWSHGIGITVVDGVPVTITEGRPLQEIPLRIEITEFTEGSAESRFIQADVPVDPTEDVATGLQSGDRLLQESEYEAALAELTSAVERALRTDPSQYTAARLREILAVGAVLKSKNELSSGIAFLESIDHQTEGLDESITQQLIAYRGILKADSLISDAANAEGVTATTYRRDAKEILEEAVDSLTPVTEPSTPSVHPLIVTALSQTSDQLILPPNAVTEYLDTV